MSLRHLAFAAACLAALTAPAFAETNITVLHVSENAGQKAVWDKTAADYNAQHKGVNVQFKYLENEAFKAKLPTMLQSNDSGPSCSTAGPAASCRRRTRRVSSRTSPPTSAPSRRRWSPTAVDAFKVDGKTVGVPFEVGEVAFYYNKKLFEKAGREGRGHQDLGRFPRRGEEAQGGRHHPDRRRRGREVADALLLFLPRHAHRRRARAGRREGRKGRRLQERDLRRGRQAPARARRARAVPARLPHDQAHASRPACSATARRRWI